MNLYVKNLKLKFASCFMVVFLLFNLIMPVVKPKKVDAAGFALGYLIAAAVYGNAIVAGSNIVLSSTDVEGLSEAFWAKAAEDGKVSEYQAQLLNYGNQLVYDSVKDAYISGSPHVSGRLLQTLTDVIVDYYSVNDGILPDNTVFGNDNAKKLIKTGKLFDYYFANGSGDTIVVSRVLFNTADILSDGSLNLQCSYIDTSGNLVNFPNTVRPKLFLIKKDGTLGFSAASFGTSFNYTWINNNTTGHNYVYAKTGYTASQICNDLNGIAFVPTIATKIKALPTYALPASIPAVTVTAIQDGADTIPTDALLISPMRGTSGFTRVTTIILLTGTRR